MTRGLTVQRLGAGDIAQMRTLNRLFGRVFADPASYEAAPPDDAYLRRALSEPHVFALIASAEGELAGGLVAYEMTKLEQARSEVYIYDLAVEAAFRRRGVATALIHELQRLAVARGAWVVFVQADYEDEPAVALYEKLGVREEVLHFDLLPAR